MRTILTLFLLIAATACARPGPHDALPSRVELTAVPVPTDTIALRREIEALNRAMEATANGGDLAKGAAFYTDDAVVRTPRQIVARGRAVIDQYFRSINLARSWKLDVIQVGGTRDVAYQVGKSTLIHGARPDTSIVDFVCSGSANRTAGCASSWTTIIDAQPGVLDHG